MSSIKNEITEIERKLLELTSFYKNDPEKATFSEILSSFKNLSKSSLSLKDTFKTSSFAKNIAKFNSKKKHIFVLDLIYMGLIYEIYNIKELEEIIINITNHSWEASYKMKILQMGFYFVRKDLSIEVFYKLLKLIVESFVIEDSSIDLISRPVVCQVIDKILTLEINNIKNDGNNSVSVNSENDIIIDINSDIDNCEISNFINLNDNNSFNNDIINNDENDIIIDNGEHDIIIDNDRIIKESNNINSVSKESNIINSVSKGNSNVFDFIHNTIVHKTNLFASYILPIVLKFKNIELHNGFYNFLNKSFIECCVIILKNGKLDEMAPVFDSIIMVQQCFSNISPNNIFFNTDIFISVYENNPQGELLLKFISDYTLLVKLPLQLSFILINYVKNVDLTTKDSEKFLKIFIKIVKNFKVEFEANEFINTIFNITTNSESISELYLESLDYCVKNDLREYFNNGLINGLRLENIKENINNFIFDKKWYMKSSWSIYFENNNFNTSNKIFDIEKLKTFNGNELESFIDELPMNSILITDIYNILLTYKNEYFMKLFIKLLEKVQDYKLLLNLLLKYYSNKDIVNNNTSITKDKNYDDIIEIYDNYKDNENIKDDFKGKPLKFLLDFLIEKSENNEKLTSLVNNIEQELLLIHTKDMAPFKKTRILLKIDQDLTVEINKFLGSVLSIKTKDSVSEIDCNILKILILGNGDIENKIKLILQIEESFICHFNDEQLELLLLVIFSVFTELEECVNIKTDYSFFDNFIKFLLKFDKKLKIWSMIHLFWVEILNSNQNIFKNTINDLVPYILTLFFNQFNNKKPNETSLFNILFFKILNKADEKTTLLEILKKVPSIFDKLKSCIKRFVEFLESKIILSEFDQIINNSYELLCLITEDPNLFHSRTCNKAFLKIISKCTKDNIILQAFLKIPYLHFNFSESINLSESLKKYVEMPEPFRSNAIDCFFKTCESSEYRFLCLETFPTWLSINSVESSINILSKIEENFLNSSYSKINGFSIFLKCSTQFSKSNIFLEPILSLIMKCNHFLDENLIEKLLDFSKVFIIDQMTVEYSKERENILSSYLDFIVKCVSFSNERLYTNLIDILSLISNTQVPYLNLKFKSYEILFNCYLYSKSELRSLLKTFIVNITKMYIYNGKGISAYSIAELLYILRLILKTKEIEILEDIKKEIVELLIIKDDLVIDYVRKILKRLFSSY